MRLSDVVKIVEAVSHTKGLDMDIEIKSACGSDLMSDVLAFVKDQALLLTGLTNPQVIRTAEMMDMKAIIFVRGKMPDNATVQLAQNIGISLFTTDLPLYLACGRLYHAGLRGEEEKT
jgi:hypothetical protein